MKKIFTSLIILGYSLVCYSQETVTDYDGNIYYTVSIGTQVWLKENLSALHYSDGTIIPEVVAYNNSDDMAAIYGRLYTWNAAMRNSTQEMAQGACPDSWHVASNSEWLILENYLGGSSVAGGKMKSTAYWNSPNTGATNSSGLTILPGGEYDAYYNPKIFRLIQEYAVIWTSTQIDALKAREKYLSFESAQCFIYDWYKVMKYSVRCIKSNTTTVSRSIEKRMEVYPTIVNNNLTVRIYGALNNNMKIQLINSLGVSLLNLKITDNTQIIDLKDLSNGIYFIRFQEGEIVYTQRIIKT